MDIDYEITPAQDAVEIAWLSPTFGKRVTVTVARSELATASQGGKIPGDDAAILKAFAKGIDGHRLENTHVLQRHVKAVLAFRPGRCDLGGACLEPWRG
jgi:hypothetical protein